MVLAILFPNIVIFLWHSGADQVQPDDKAVSKAFFYLPVKFLTQTQVSQEQILTCKITFNVYT